MISQTYCETCKDYAPCEHIQDKSLIDLSMEALGQPPLNPNFARDVARIDEIIGNIHQMMKQPVWQPAETEPVKVIHERRARENRLKSMGTSIKLTGGKTREDY